MGWMTTGPALGTMAWHWPTEGFVRRVLWTAHRLSVLLVLVVGSASGLAAQSLVATASAGTAGAGVAPPFNFQPEYSTARSQNVIPWGIGPYMINNQFEIGHFEPCTRVTGPVTSAGDTYYKQCHGPYEVGKDSGKVFEPNDAPCYRFGDTHGGKVPPNPVTGCDVFFNAIGDLDYDGSPYRADWLSSTTAGPFPSPFLQRQPTTTGGRGAPSGPSPGRSAAIPAAEHAGANAWR
jgi:hypothetical protein